MLTRSGPPAKSEDQASPDHDGAALLLAWYDRHRRILPWRALPGAAADPYAVWLSEIMLQQTTVTAVKPYYEAFLARWPNVQALADAETGEVMKAWAGLGYYSRARHLHACAKQVVETHGGFFPGEEDLLRKLPGIGPYTAAAVTAIAFGRRAVVVDGNVERVVARLFRVQEAMPAAKIAIRKFAAVLTPAQRAGDFAQAMMDLGATICSPKNPACSLCPLNAICEGFRTGDAASYPRRAAKTERPQRYGAAFYIRRSDGGVFVRTRPPKGLLGGMTEFPGTEWSAYYDLARAVEDAPVKLDWTKRMRQVEHVFTHFSLRLDVYVAQMRSGSKSPAGGRFVNELDLDGEALPSVMRKVAKIAQNNQSTFVK